MFADEVNFKNETHISKMLGILNLLFTSEVRGPEKPEMQAENFGVPITTEMERSMATMCNLSQGIKEDALLEGRLEGHQEGL